MRFRFLQKGSVKQAVDRGGNLGKTRAPREFQPLVPSWLSVGGAFGDSVLPGVPRKTEGVLCRTVLVSLYHAGTPRP